VIYARHVDFIAQPVSDLLRAAEFYGGVLGLHRNPASGDRWIEFETGNLTIGLSTFGPALAFRVDDVAEARSTLEGEGIEFQMDTFDSGVCHGAPFSDPDGNRLVVHRRYAPAEPFDVPETEVQRTDFVGVSVTDRARAGEFYSGTLGLSRNENNSSPDWPEVEADNVGLILSTPEQRYESEHKPSVYSLAFRVADVGTTIERLQGDGVEFPFGSEPYDSGVCHMAFFTDPDGNPLILHHRYAPYPDGTTP
jgi:predicted enzyme related to lactoylglutathione lyase